jgi:hypothetical protein
MSNKISYILEVLDGYSAITKDLKKELSEIQKLTKFKFNSSDFKGLAEFAKQADKIATSAERLKKAKTGFTLIGESFSSSKINAAALRANRAYEKSLKNAIVPFNNPFTMMGGGRSGGYYNPKAYKPNFNIPINSTYRRDAAGTAIVPYSRGGAVMSYGQRPMIDVTGTGRTINQESTASWQSEQRYNPKQKAEFLRRGGNTSSDNSRSSGGVSFKNVAKGMGYYRAIDMAVSVPSKIHDVTIQMDGLRAGLAALIPTVKGMKGATAEGEVNYLRGVADKYGADFTTIAPSYLKLLGTGGSSDAPLIKGLLENVSGYAGLLNLETPAFERTMLGFQDMLSKQVLNAQEVNLQMANLPGAKPMFHKAYKRYAEKRGAKGITDENASIYFTQAMATGKLSSVDVLRELVQIMNEMFGEDMIKKSFTLGREEKRLKNAFQELGDQIGLLTYDTQIGAVRGLTKMTDKVNTSLSTITSSFSILDEAMKDSTLYKIVKGMAKGLKDVVVDGTGEAIKAPFKLAQAAGGLITGTITGDEEGRKEIKRELRNYYFGNTNAAIANNNLANDPQKIEITIKSDNNIQVKDVKSNRPSTVKAGQK